MPSRIYDEDLRLRIILDGKELPKENRKLLYELGKLEEQFAELEAKSMKLRHERRLVGEQLGRNSTQYKSLTSQIRANDAAMKDTVIQMKKLRDQTGLAGMNLTQLRTHAKSLQAQLAQFRHSPRIMADLRKELDRTNREIVKLSTGAGYLQQRWDRFAKKANQYGTAIAWLSLVTYGIGRAVHTVTGRMKELDDILSDVIKTVGFTREEAWQLKETFDAWDTRTPTDELLQMAKIAGRLGFNVETMGQKAIPAIEEFVRSFNMINVALGDDLEGDIEDIALKLGQLVNVLGTEKNYTTSEALERVGSVLNELDKNTKTTAGSILEFMSRLGKIANLSGMSEAALASYSAAIAESGVASERGATNMQKIILALGKEAEAFSRILGIDISEYYRRLDKDVNQVFLSVLKTLKPTREGLSEVVTLVEKYGVNNDRAIEVLGALVGSIDRVQELQTLANKAFEQNISLREEWMVKEQGFAGQLEAEERRTKALSDAWKKQLQPTALAAIRLWNDFYEALANGARWIEEHTHIIKGLALALVAFKASTIASTAAKIKANLAIKANHALDKISIFLTNAKTVATIAHTKGLRAANVALKEWYGTMALNPLTAFIAVLGAAAAAFYFLQNRINSVDKAILNFNNEINEQTGRLNQYVDMVKQTAAGTEERKKAVERLNTAYGKYFDNQITELSNLRDIKLAQEQANDKLKEAIALKYRDDKADEALADASKKRQKANKNLVKYVGGYTGVQIGQFEAELFLMQEKLNEFYSETRKMDKEQKDLLNKSFQENVINNLTDKWINVMMPSLEKMGEIQFPDTEFKDLTEAQKEALEINRQLFKEDNIENLRERIEKYVSASKQMYDQQQNVNDIFNAFITTLDVSNQKTKSGTVGQPSITSSLSEEDFNAQKQDLLEQYEEMILINAQKRNELNKSEEWYRKQNKEAEKQYLLDLIALQKEYYGNKNPVDLLKNQQRLEQLQFPDQIKNKSSKAGADLQSVPTPSGDAEKYMDSIFQKMVTQQNELFAQGVMSKEDLDYKILKLEEEKWKGVIQAQTAAHQDITKAENELSKVRKKLAEEFLSEEEKKYNLAKQKVDEHFQALKQNTDERYVEGKLTEEEYNRELENLELTHTLQLLSIRQGLALSTEELEKALLDKKIQFMQREMSEAQKTANYINQVYGDRSSFLAKAISLEQEKINVTKDLGLTDVERTKKLQVLTQAQEKLFQAEAQTAALRAVSAAEGAKSFEEATNAILNSIRQQIKAYIAQAIAAAVAKEIGSKGIFGIITAAFVAGTVGALFDAIIPQFATGHYPDMGSGAGKTTSVTGASDGKTYNARYVGQAQTGIYNKPSLGLFSEKGPEMIIDYPTLKNMQFNAPEIIEAIHAMRVPQYAAGNYPDIYEQAYTRAKARLNSGQSAGADLQSVPPENEKMLATLNNLTQALDNMQRNGLAAYIDLYGEKGFKEGIDKVNDFNNLIGE